ALARGPQEHPRCVRASEDLVGDRGAVLRDGEEILLRVVDRLRDRKRHLARLAVTDANAVDLVANDDERGEREPPAALDDLRDTVRARDHETRPLDRPGHLAPHALVAALPCCSDGQSGHQARLPTFRRTYSPSYRMPLPL